MEGALAEDVMVCLIFLPVFYSTHSVNVSQRRTDNKINKKNKKSVLNITLKSIY